MHGAQRPPFIRNGAPPPPPPPEDGTGALVALRASGIDGAAPLLPFELRVVDAEVVPPPACVADVEAGAAAADAGGAAAAAAAAAPGAGRGAIKPTRRSALVMSPHTLVITAATISEITVSAVTP